MKLTLRKILCLSLVLTASLGYSQNKIWTKNNTVTDSNALSKYHLEPSKVESFTFNANTLNQRVQLAPVRGESRSVSNTIIEVPVVGGEFEQFRIYESQIFSSELAAQYPNIKSYVGYSLENPTTRLSMSSSPQGVQTMISYVNKETVFMMPTSPGSTDYILYTKASRGVYDSEFVCSTIDELVETSQNRSDNEFQRDANDQTLRSYRLAISVNGEYTAYHGGTVAGALAAINTTMTRVNSVFETDMAITFTIVNAPQLIYTNAASDPYSGNLGNWNLELANTLDANLADGDYDIGHMFGASGGGGNAGCIGCVCVNGNVNTGNHKGSGITSPADNIPETDTFDIDYVAHEIGHQMGANHTFSMNTETANVNVEPGSGTTIMGYAGITGVNNVALNSDPYFHYASINQILNNVNSGPNQCATTTAIANNPPIADAGPNYIIPKGTAYVLKGTATDADGDDMLTYCWEQNNSGQVTNTSFGPTSTIGAQARSLPPSMSPDRYIPNFDRVLNNLLTETNPGLTSDWETVSNVARNLTWALTVRDREPSATGLNGQSSFDLTTITVNGTAGPFTFTSQNDGSTWLSGTDEIITWDVAGTTANGINTSNVNILLSTDGGLNFDTILASNTPNDGSETITVPDAPSIACRIMIEPVGNIYYALNSSEFALDFDVTTDCLEYTSAENLNLAIPDGPGGNGNPGAPVTSIINIPDSQTIDFITVNADISHEYINDIIIEVIHPDGATAAIIYNRECGSQDDLDVTFADGSPGIVCATPTVGEYGPSFPLSVFNGLDSSGDWTISVTDNWDAITGTLNDWSIEICTTTVTPLSVDEFAVGDFSIFPNPNNGEFTIKLNSSSNQDITVDVFDIRGRKIFDNTYVNNSDFNQSISLNNVQSGMYLVKVSDGKKQTTKKIVIE
ncbi:reprolysin-like metallopeptidase [Psychroserpens sp. Hel_I_66]|uniref:zinc-dependent metalloprotease n=1 Tax=Psychroserpens sp. Hel_I_66 TaxID=1250004 RepID=UPI000691C333|nr:zinc-dependent metalloprotease family protein [Psychroserpens sp. Hel_I_66]